MLSNVNTGSKYPCCCTKWASLGRIRINAGVADEKAREEEYKGRMSLEKRDRSRLCMMTTSVGAQKKLPEMDLFLKTKPLNNTRSSFRTHRRHPVRTGVNRFRAPPKPSVKDGLRSLGTASKPVTNHK